jgi:hypothetical protein
MVVECDTRTKFNLTSYLRITRRLNFTINQHDTVFFTENIIDMLLFTRLYF